jgi:hypothetical protein
VREHRLSSRLVLYNKRVVFKTNFENAVQKRTAFAFVDVCPSFILFPYITLRMSIWLILLLIGFVWLYAAV